MKNYLLSLLVVHFSFLPAMAVEQPDHAVRAAELIGSPKEDWVEIGELYQQRFGKEGAEFHKYFLSKLATKGNKVKFTRVGATRVSVQIATTTAILDFFDPQMKEMKINNYKINLENVRTYSDLESQISKAFYKKSFRAALFGLLVPQAQAQDLSTILLMVPLLAALMGGGPMMTLMSMTVPAFALMMKASQPTQRYDYPQQYPLQQSSGPLGGMFGIR